MSVMPHLDMKTAWFAALVLAFGILTGCHTLPRPGSVATPRMGDEIVAAGQFVHTGARVVLWMDPGGYDAYRVERRFSPYAESGWESSKEAVKDLSTPNRFGLRQSVLKPDEVERVRGGGWDLALLQEKVDQFVLHFDVSGTSRQCFKVLHDLRGLSVHFLLDLDGTIYQTLDLKERAWHATSSNSRSIGVEIANIGAYPTNNLEPLHEWYKPDADGRVQVVIPETPDGSGMRTPAFQARPARPEPVTGVIQGQELVQYDFTPEQYQALIQLTAAPCRVFPKLTCDYPRDASGQLIREALPEPALQAYRGLLGHYHVQTNKVDPGPAFQWDKLVAGVRRWLNEPGPDPGTRQATRLMTPARRR